MKRCLVFLTSSFPYGGNEPFIENEIFFHEKNFDKIIILAQELEPDAELKRSVPEIADVYNITKKKKKLVRYGDIIGGTVNLIKPYEMNDDDKAEMGSSPINKVIAGYFNRRAFRQFDEDVKILEKYDFSEYDEIVLYSYWFFSNCKTCLLLKKWFESKGKKALVYSRAHNYDLYKYHKRFNYLPCRTELLKGVEKVFPCSENGSEYLKKEYPKYKDKAKCSYLGTFDHGLTGFDKTFHIVTCSRVVEFKRLDRLIEAFAGMKDSLGDVYWTHIGEGPLSEEVKALCKEKLGDSVKYEFLGDFTNQQVLEYYQNHPVNLFINVSRIEGLPVSMMEVISYGIPVLATEVGGVNEIVYDDVNGFLLKKDFTNEEFAQRLNRFINMSDEEYLEFRKNARRIWEEKFNAEKNYPEFSANLVKPFERV